MRTSTLYGQVGDVLMQGYQAAEQQAHEAVGTPLETAARNAAVYYAVPLMLIADGENSYVQGLSSKRRFIGRGRAKAIRA